jgi:hypothetical protein
MILKVLEKNRVMQSSSEIDSARSSPPPKTSKLPYVTFPSRITLSFSKKRTNTQF